MSFDNFAYLALGFLEYAQGSADYPPKLHFGLATLTRHLGTNAPRTLQGMVKLCSTSPIEAWWPHKRTPPDIDKAMPLFSFTTDGVLFSESVQAYLETFVNDSRYRAEKTSLLHASDSHNFRTFRQKQLARFADHPEKAQEAYELLRAFLVQNPFTTKNAISTLAISIGIDPATVRAFYSRFSQVENELRDPDNDHIWRCQCCGPVRLIDDELQSVKEDVCGAHCPQFNGGWQVVNSAELVLRRGIQESVLIPGVPELYLFEELGKLKEAYPEQIGRILLWPQIDLFDIALYFNDALWVIDVKDLDVAKRSAQKINDIRKVATYQWDEAFYVYPDRRDQDPKYAFKFRQQATLYQTKLLNISCFLNAVRDKLNSGKERYVSTN